MTPPFSHSLLAPQPAGPDLERVVCDLCGADDARTLATLPPPDALPSAMHRLGASVLDLTGGPIRFVRCAHCGLVYMNPRLTEPAIARFYDTVYAVQGAAGAFEDMQHARVAYVLDQIERLLPASPPPRLLDIGCGAGQLLRGAQQRGWEIQGSELSAVAVERATLLLGAPIHHGDFRAMALAPGSLDVVTLLSVVEHLRAPVDFLRASAALLRPGGVLMFNVPNVASWEYRLAAALRQPWRGFIVEHLTYYTPAVVIRLLADLGFEVARLTSWKPGGALPNPLRDVRRALPRRDAPLPPATPSPDALPPALPAAPPATLPRRALRQLANYALDTVSALSEGRRDNTHTHGNALFVWAVKQ